MIAKLNRKEQENFIGLLASMGRGNGVEAADFVMNFSTKQAFTVPTCCIIIAIFTRLYLAIASQVYSHEARVKFRVEMVALFGKVCRGYGTDVDIGTVLRGILVLIRDNKISIGANYATLVLNALCLDGLGKQILPSYNILDGGKPLLEFYRGCRRTIGTSS